jgi:[ribosomal protein S5]-alanine N-acetyltransferase
MQDFPPIQTERLTLRPFQADDLDFTFQHFSDPQVAQYLLDEPPITDRSQAQEIVRFYLDSAGKSYNRWAIISKADGQRIGTCGFHKWNKNHQRAEVGYDLSPMAWGHGYMQEALHAAIQFGFAQMKLHRIEALVHPENVRSLHLLNKLGFKQEGTLRDYFYLDGKFYNHMILSLLKA